MARNDLLKIGLLAAVAIETLCCSYFLEYQEYIRAISITYVITGLVIAILPLLSNDTIESQNQNPGHLVSAFIWGFFIFIGSLLIYYSFSIFKAFPLDYRISDMLPQIKVISQRFINGEPIYVPMHEIWEGKLPPYLPMMWLPFVPLEFLQYDIRWTSIGIMIVGLFLLMQMIRIGKPSDLILTVITFTSLFLLINYMSVGEKLTIGTTEEGLIIGYYLFLAFAIVRKHAVLIGIAISLCLLSRFSLLFWVPVYLAYLFFFESKKKAGITMGVITLILLVVFFIPFGFGNMDYFIQLPELYKEGTERVWELTPQVVYSDLGLAKFFHVSQIPLIRTIQLVTVIVMPILAVGVYALLKSRNHMNVAIFGLCSLKLTLVFFYNFLEAPYFYLFFVPTFFSYSILFNYFKTGDH